MKKLFLLISIALLGCISSFELEYDVDFIIGIDLGTTYSCVGVYQNRRVDIIPNDQGNRITPSYVAFKETGGRLLGDAAMNQITTNPVNTIFDVKRLIGRTWDDKLLQNDIKNFPYKVIEVNNKPYIEVDVGGVKKSFAPEEISSMVLMKMKETAENYLGKKVTHAVVTVPAYFNDAQRRATRDAGTIAGLNVARIINEPTAAAIAYGLDKRDDKKTILIFDLGGGTFDVSLMTISNGVFKVKAVDGDTHLGGEDFDERVVNHFIKIFKTKTGHDISKDNRARQRLRREVEKGKRLLSFQLQTRIELESLYKGQDFSETLTRAKFESINMDLFRSTMTPLQQVIKDSGVAKRNIDEIVLVGGSTRIPKIQELVTDFFNGKKPSKGINPDEAVAQGAAVLGGHLCGADKIGSVLLKDVTPLSVGIETYNRYHPAEGYLLRPFIRRNTEIPCTNTFPYTTDPTEAYQTEVILRVFEGERKLAKDNHFIGEFTLSGLRSLPAGVPTYDITFNIDANGILKVTAVDRQTRSRGSITISSRRSSLSTEEIERMIEDADKFAEDDEMEKQRVLAKNNLEAFAHSISSVVEDNVMRLSEKVIQGADAILKWTADNQHVKKKAYDDKYSELIEIKEEL